MDGKTLPKLTKRQEAFCKIYISNGFNATQAAIEAGYSKKNARIIAAENLSKTNIKKFIESLLKPKMEKLELDAEYVIRKLKAFAEAKITDYFEINRFKIVLKNLKTLSEEKIIAIESIEETKGGKIKIKLVDRLAAVIDIGRALNMFKEGILIITICK